VAVCHSGADFKRRLARAHADAYLLDVGCLTRTASTCCRALRLERTGRG
jgi:DNA-binding response OmpR family regulator